MELYNTGQDVFIKKLSSMILVIGEKEMKLLKAIGLDLQNK